MTTRLCHQWATQTCALIMLSILACCEPADRPGGPWSFRGSIACGEDVAVEGDLRVAFVWTTDAQGLWVAAVAEDVPVRNDLPTSFSLDLSGSPPAEVLFDGGVTAPDLDGIDMAIGALVVYEDGDADDELDLMTADAPAFVDTVWAHTNLANRVGADIYQFIYIDSSQPRSLDRGYKPIMLEPGLNMLHEHTFEDPGDAHAARVPIDTPVEIELRDAELLRLTACMADQSGNGDDLWSEVRLPPDEFVQAAAPQTDKEISCLDHGRYVSFIRCEPMGQGICAPAHPTPCTLYETVLGEGEPLPDGWPCPVE